MGFMDEYYKVLQEESQKSGSGGTGTTNGSNFMAEYNRAIASVGGFSSNSGSNQGNLRTFDAPVSERIASRTTVSSKKKKKKDEEEKERKWFQKGLFEDGYDLGDISKTILGTVTDTAENVGAGIMGMGEKAIDALAWMAPAMENAAFYQNGGGYNLELEKAHKEAVEESKKGINDFIAKDLYDEEAVAKAIITNPVQKISGVKVEDTSVFGEKSDALIQSAGQLAAQYGLTAVGVPWFVTSGLTSFGGETENALRQGASHEEAGASAAISAGAEVLSEKLFGGDVFVGKSGSDLATTYLSRAISNKALRTMAKLGIDSAGESFEEAFSEAMGNLGSALYKEENLGEILFSEEALEGYLEAAIGGGVLGGAMGGINAVQSGKAGKDFTSGLTANEETVVQKVYNDRVAEAEKNGKISQKEKTKIYDQVVSEMDKGYLSIDDIESALGGKTYEDYKKVSEWEDSLQEEYNELHKMKRGDMTGEQLDREAELKKHLEEAKTNGNRDILKSQLGEEVFGLVKGDRLAESYNERTRRGQKFEADLTKYDAKQQGVIQKAIDSGILNNTNRTHEFVDIIAKISADKGVLFDFTNNARLKESGFAIEGKQVNGYVSKDGITLNIDSTKAWQKTVGHEVTHVLEGTELYTELQNTLVEYAKSKGEYDSRYQSLTELYKDIEDANIDNELTADLVGEYLFTDEEFIKNLSVNNKNVFQKIYDEIKYLAKVATGSKEARELEKVKRAFEKAYKEAGKAQSDTKYSVSYTTENRAVATIENDIFDGKFEELSESERIKTVKNAIKGFRPGVPVSGRLIGITRKSAEHFTNSDYTDKIRNHDPQLYEDKLNIAQNIDDVIYASTDYINEDLKHPRKDNITEFARGTVLLDIGGNKYEANVLVGYTTMREMVLYDVQDLTPTTFDIKKKTQPKLAGNESDTRKTVVSSEIKVPQNGEKVKLSLSDSDGKRLTAQQQKYFRDSKVRDENGSLLPVYHGSKNSGFNTFQYSKDIQTGTDYGEAYYFTSDRQKASGYSYDVTKDERVAKYQADRELLKHRFLKTRSKADADAFLNYSYEGKKLADLIDDESYNTEGGEVKEVYLNLKNPLVADAGGKYYYEVYPEYFDKARKNGNDGIIVKNVIDNPRGEARPIDTYIAFHPEQIKNVDNLTPTKDPDIRKSLSAEGEQFGNSGQFATPATHLRYEAPATDESSLAAPTKETLTTEPPGLTTDVGKVTAEEMQELFPDDLAPVQGELERLDAHRKQLHGALEVAIEHGSAEEVGKLAAEYEEVSTKIKALESEETDRAGSLSDTDAPPEMDAPFYGESENETVENPFDKRDWYKVGNQKVKAYMYENPEVKPFFQEEAMNLLGELNDTQKGERWYNDDLYYASGGEKGWGGQKRLTSDSIATLLDGWGMSYADIEKGLNAIIEDHGEENIAAAKKIEFMLNDRLLNGYKNFYDNGYIEPNQDYINLLSEKQINSYSKEAFERFMQDADMYAPFEEKPLKKATPDTLDAPLFESNGQTTMFEEAEEQPSRGTRKELHSRIIDSIKTAFTNRGFDFDKVLKNAKNLSTWSTVDNTPQRVMEKSLGYKEGGILADITVNKVAQNETEGIKWLNAYVDQLKQISKEYGIKPGSKESAAAQMYAEGFYVNENNEIVQYGDPELIQDFGNSDVRRRIKGLARDARIRKIYDDTLANINDSRTRNLYPEIPKLDNYFLHFRAMEDTFSTLGLPFNPNDIRAKDLPTDLNGVTADLKPGQPYFASAMHRMGKRTSFDLLGGVERYLNSAKNQIYHIDDIQTLRALRNYIAETYGQATGLEEIDSMSDAEAEERIKQVYGSHLSTFAKFLNEEANVLAGKTALIDRGVEGIIGRRGITFLNTLNRQVGSNMVGYNVSSSLTNFLPVAQTFAKTNKFDFTKAFAQTVANKLSGGRLDSFAEDSPVVIRRKGEDRFYRTPWQKMADPGYALMGLVDDISTEIIARTKYNEFTRKGMDSQKAHFETDKWVSRLMGDRSLGQQPQLYNSKMLGLFTKFQLEVRNQLDSQFYDTIQETKVSNEHIQNGLARNAKTATKVASVFAQLAIAQHLYGKAFESVAGYNPAFDIIEVLLTTLGLDDEEEEDTIKENLEQGFEALMEDLPYASVVTGGGRIPVSAALPVKEFFKGEDQYGNEKSRWEILGEVAPYYLMPGGYGQVKKTKAGLEMFSEDHPIAGSYTDSGNLRFPVEDTTGNRIKAGIFGQYASENARKYFNQEQRTLNPEQTEVFAGLDIPIEEYWEYRDKLNKFYAVKDKTMDAAFADGATDEDKLKGWYIDAINDELYDLYDQQKEIASGDSKNKTAEMRKLQSQMERLISDSQKAMNNVYINGYYAEIGDKRYDYSDYSDGWYEIEGKYLKQEKNAIKRYGITPEEYWNNTDLYYKADWYFDDKYASNDRELIANTVFGGKRFAPYAAELGQIKGEDLDGDGKTDSGSKKDKIIDYINGLDMDYGEKIIMYRTMYSSKDDKKAYNQDIIDYLNERDDISAQEMRTILEELDFKVDSEGYITW